MRNCKGILFRVRNTSQGCGTLVCLLDLRTVFKADEGAEQKLADRSLKDFLTNSKEFKNCPEVECWGIVPTVGKKGADVVHVCDICQSNVCKGYYLS